MASIVLVDNEPLVRGVLAEILQQSGHQVSIANTGAESLDIVSAQPVDLVLLDVNMPGMDGWETLRRLRDSEPAVRVLMMSGHDLTERALEEGAVGFVVKPYRPAEIVEQVSAALEA